MNVGAKIRAARIAKGMTQEELGQMLGVQKSAVAKYESGRVVNIKRSTLKKISDILGIRPSELIFEEMQKNNEDISDLIIKLRSDDKFLSVVKSLYSISPEQLAGVEKMLNAFLK